jgi:hypothetical protein
MGGQELTVVVIKKRLMSLVLVVVVVVVAIRNEGYFLFVHTRSKRWAQENSYGDVCCKMPKKIQLLCGILETRTKATYRAMWFLSSPPPCLPPVSRCPMC